MITENLEMFLSVRPKHMANILNGEKLKEVRKIFPDFKGTIHLYCTKAPVHLVYVEEIGKYMTMTTGALKLTKKEDLNGKVVGYFECKKVESIKLHEFPYTIQEQELIIESKVSFDDLKKYSNGKAIRAIDINNLKIYKEPLNIGDFVLPCKVDICSKCKRFFGQKNSDYCNQLTIAPQSYCWIKGVHWGVCVDVKEGD